MIYSCFWLKNILSFLFVHPSQTVLFVCPSIHPSIHPSQTFFVRPSITDCFFHSSIHPSVRPSQTVLSDYPSPTVLSIRPAILDSYLSIYVLICLSIHISIQLSISLFIYLSIYSLFLSNIPNFFSSCCLYFHFCV